jgi:alpha-glucosidase
MQMLVRAYDDGVAFRYIFPEGFSGDSILITEEMTSFRFNDADTAWWAPAEDFAYESLYKKNNVKHVGAASTPFTVKSVSGYWLSVHEATLVDYSEMYLKPMEGDSGSFSTALHPWPDGVACKALGKYQTPWRCVLMETDQTGLINSSLVRNLNEPSAIKDMSWIKPIRFIGIWWGMHQGKFTWSEGERHGATTDRTKKNILFAQEHGIEGVLVEGWNKGWDTWASDKIPLQDFTQPTNDFDPIALTHFARAKGINLVGHHETGGNITEYERQMEAAFSYYASLGVRYLKTGYAGKILPDGMHHHGQFMVRHFQKVVELAARHQMCLNVHESIKPTGLDRTWPHLLTQEAVRGNEWNATYKPNPPSHSVTLPFTRGIAGPFDYTPGLFNINHTPEKNKRIYNLITHQLAQCVVFESPMLMFADEIEQYENHPLWPFVKNIKATWDTTVVVAADIGRMVCLARKSGSTWVVAGLSGNESSSLDLDFRFLDKAITYKATIIHDVPASDLYYSPTQFGKTEMYLGANDIIPMPMLPGGGFFIALESIDSATISAESQKRYIENSAKFKRIFEARRKFGDNRVSHIGVGKPVKRAAPFSEQYPASGMNALNDGLRGSVDYSDGCWQGYLGTGVDVTIDLGIPDTVGKVRIGFLEAPSSWIFLPEEVELSYSMDGVVFQKLAPQLLNRSKPFEMGVHLIKDYEFENLNFVAKFIKLRSKGSMVCPEGHPGAGNPSWVFVDEVLIDRKK